MKITLFLGAGFSRAYGLPVMTEFLSFADQSYRLNEEEKKLIGRIVLEARSANSFLQSSPVNLEDILSFSEMKDRLKHFEDGEESQNSNIRRILQKIYTDIGNDILSSISLDCFKNFLAYNYS